MSKLRTLDVACDQILPDGDLPGLPKNRVCWNWVEGVSSRYGPMLMADARAEAVTHGWTTAVDSDGVTIDLCPEHSP